MADSTHLKLPYIEANQAQKHVTHNEAVRLLDALVQMAVISRTLTVPPGSPADGDRYIVAAGATGAWAGWDLNIAYYVDGAWMKLVPQQGWLAWIEAEAAHVRWDGTAWGGLSSSGSVAWGSITGTLSNQTDLQAALNGKANTSHTHTASQISDSTAAGRSMLTAADAAAQTALLNVFASGLKGLAPASGGGTTNFLRADGTWAAPPGGGGSGDVVGPASATDNAVARFDSTTGKVIQNSGATIDDNGKLSLPVVSAASAPLNIGDGATTPTTPVNGDLWTNGGYVRYRSGGVNYALAPLSIANSWTAKQTFVTPTTSIPSINLPHGVAPTTPANGDMWSTTSGLFMRVNTVTVQFSIAGHTHVAADISDSTAAGRSMLAAADAAAQTALLNTFTSALKGLAPASGGGTANFLRADGTWAAPPDPTALQNLSLLGVNATADATNKLAVASSAILFNNVGNGMQVKVNKNAAADTASFLFQTNFSGRAEFGTAGDDDFHFKVSADGSTWFEALTINRTNGVISLPQGLSALPSFTSSAKGVVPASGGGTTNFLRADGTWVAPSGGGGSGDVVGPASAVRCDDRQTDPEFARASARRRRNHAALRGNACGAGCRQAEPVRRPQGKPHAAALHWPERARCDLAAARRLQQGRLVEPAGQRHHGSGRTRHRRPDGAWHSNRQKRRRHDHGDSHAQARLCQRRDGWLAVGALFGNRPVHDWRDRRHRRVLLCLPVRGVGRGRGFWRAHVCRSAQCGCCSHKHRAIERPDQYGGRGADQHVEQSADRLWRLGGTDGHRSRSQLPGQHAFR
jgi:hypothetical protein